MKWYLIQTKPNAHSIASTNLIRQNFEVFLPLISKTSKKGGQFINVIKPLFPSYLFIGSKLDQISWKSINATRGVSKAVTLDGSYRAIKKDIIEGLKYRCDLNGLIKLGKYITPNDRVKLEKGPFADFICRVEDIADDQRVWVLINLMQQTIRTSVSLCDLSKIN